MVCWLYKQATQEMKKEMMGIFKAKHIVHCDSSFTW